MQSDGNVIGRHGVHPPAQAWEMIREWAGRHITREGILDAALAAGTIGSISFIIVILHGAFQNYTMTGF